MRGLAGKREPIAGSMLEVACGLASRRGGHRTASGPSWSAATRWAASCASGGETPFSKAGPNAPTVHPEGSPEMALPAPASASGADVAILARTP